MTGDGRERPIQPCRPGTRIRARVVVPGSKSLTQRALVAAALGRGTSRLDGPLDSEDTRLLRDALISLGMQIRAEGGAWVIQGTGGTVQPHGSDLYLGNNGTGIRFLVSVTCLGQGLYRLTGSPRMAERPVEPLLLALRAWGAEAQSIHGTGCPPVEVRAGGLKGGVTLLSAAQSSQFLSSLLLVAPYTRRPAKITLDGPLVSRPYVDLTRAVMADFGIDVTEEGGVDRPVVFSIPQGRYIGRAYRIEADASSASYFWAAAAVTGGRVTVANMPPRPLQGDAAMVDLLGRMGCTVERDARGVTVQGPPGDGLTGINADMRPWPDVVPTIAVVAAFAQGSTRITNVGHLRIKETDRLRAVATELSRMGAQVRELDDGLLIEGGAPLHGTSVRTYDDHRMAMAFAVAGLRVPGISIQDPQCVGKSFPTFWDVWDELAPRPN